MFLLRHRFNPSKSSLHQLLIKPLPYCHLQIRLKTTKHIYKGSQPRRHKNKSRFNNVPSKPALKAPIRTKTPKDPLQGMREANEKDKLRKSAFTAAAAVDVG